MRDNRMKQTPKTKKPLKSLLIPEALKFNGSGGGNEILLVVFLEMNGISLNGTLEKEDPKTGKTLLYLFMIRVASGEIK